MLSSVAREYARILLDTSRSRRPMHTLTLGEALAEVSTTAGELADDRPPPNRSDQRSLRVDVAHAFKAIGPAVSGAMSPQIAAVRASIAARDAFEDRSSTVELRRSAVEALQRLAEPEVAQAALCDLVNALASNESSAATCALRAQQFREVSQRRGHWWDLYKPEVMQALRHDADAAMTVAAMPEIDKIAVVWLAFADAVLKPGHRRIGPIQFFSGDLSTQEMREGSPSLDMPEFEPALELPLDATAVFGRIPAEHYVLARVEIAGRNAVTPPLTTRASSIAHWARDFASHVVSAAAFRVGGSEWRLLDGAVQFDAEGQCPSVSFKDPTREDNLRQWIRLRDRATDDLLVPPDAAFIANLAAGAQAATHALSDALWHQATSKITEPAQRVALRIRGFERQFAPGHTGSWTDPVLHFLSGTWATDHISALLSNLASAIRLRVELRSPQSAPTPLEHAFAATHRKIAPGHFEIDLREVLANAAEVLPYLPQGSLGWRTCRQVAHHAHTGASFCAWHAETREEFATLVRRSARQRNAIVHGREVIPAVVLTVDDFLADVNTILVSAALEARDEPIIDYLNRTRQHYDAHLARLSTTASPIHWLDVE